MVELVEPSLLVIGATAGDLDPRLGCPDPRPQRPPDRRRAGVPRREPGAAPGAGARLPGEPRRADRPDQPARVREAASSDALDRPRARTPARQPRADLPRPRPVQGRQRHLRPPGRRRAAQAAHRALLQAQHPRHATPSPGSAATSSACCSRTARWKALARSPSACAPAVSDFRFVWQDRGLQHRREHRPRAESPASSGDAGRGTVRRRRRLLRRPRRAAATACTSTSRTTPRSPSATARCSGSRASTRRATRTASSSTARRIVPICTARRRDAAALRDAAAHARRATGSWSRPPTSSRPPSATT